MSIGLAGGLETLASHAFGCNNNYLAGCYYHRAVVIVTALFCTQSIFLWNAEDILLFFGQQPKSAHYAGNFIRIYLPGVFMVSQIEVLRRFLSVQGVYFLIVKIQ